MGNRTWGQLCQCFGDPRGEIAAHMSSSACVELVQGVPQCWAGVGALPWRKIVTSLAIFAVGFLLDDIFTGVAMYRARHLLQNPDTYPALPDVGFDLVPTWTRLCANSEVESYFLLVVMVYTLFRMMVFQDGGIGIFCRFAVVDGVLMFLRATCIAITSLNNPWPECYQCGALGECPSSLGESVLYTVMRFPFYDCGDLIFSGHTVHFVMVGLVWSTYAATPLKKVETKIVWAAIVAGICMLLSCRFHYSIDILIGFYLTVGVWFYWGFAAVAEHGRVSAFVRWIDPSSDRSLPLHKAAL